MKSKMDAIKKLKENIKKAGSKKSEGAPAILIAMLAKKKKKKKKEDVEELAIPQDVLGGE